MEIFRYIHLEVSFVPSSNGKDEVKHGCRRCVGSSKVRRDEILKEMANKTEIWVINIGDIPYLSMVKCLIIFGWIRNQKMLLGE